MTRRDDDKMDVSRERLDEYDRKSELRFTKQARATLNSDGSLNADKIDDTHRTDGGEQRF